MHSRAKMRRVSRKMLKQSASGVLASFQTLHVPQRVRVGPSLAAALLDGLFEHLAEILPCGAHVQTVKFSVPT